MAGKFLRRLRFILGPLKNSYKRYVDSSARRRYHAWAVHNELECFVDDTLPETHLISIVAPVYNPETEHLREMVYSVINQHYQNWELILVNASSRAESKAATIDCAQIDRRISIVTPEKNHGISANTNLGLEAVTGDFVVFMDHDDLLHPCALHAMVAAQAAQKAELIYTDEDKVTHNGDYFYGPHCKPDWSPHLLENLNYINHLVMVKTAHVKGVNGLRSECDGAQDLDFLHRVIDTYQPRVAHAPYVLYHWRAAHSSTAHDISTKTYVFKAGQKAIQDHLDRRKTKARAAIMQGKPGFYHVAYQGVKGVSIVIGQVEKRRQPACANWLLACMRRYDGEPVEALVGDWFEPYLSKSSKNIKVLTAKNYAHYLEQAAQKATFDAIVCFQEAATPRTKEALFELAAAGLRSGAAAVQPIVVGPDNTIIDAGLVDAVYGYQPLFRGLKLGATTFFGDTDWVRNVPRVGEGVFATSKSHLARIAKRDTPRPYHILPAPDAYVLWPHAVFEWQSQLTHGHLPSFSPLLDQAMSEVRMYGSSWNIEEGRADEG